MRRTFASFLFALSLLATFGAAAQTPFNPGDPGSPKNAPTPPLNYRNWREVLAPQPCPNGATNTGLNTCGDGRDGYVWGWDSFVQRMELRPPKILYGPGAMTSNNQFGAPVQNAWNPLYGSIGANGFRGGLTAYVPVGNYNGNYQVTFASNSANATWTVRVLMGTWLQTSGSQQGILIIPRIATNAITAAGSPVLNFASTAGISAGMVAYDITTKTAITQTAPGTTVLSVTATTVTLSTNIVGGVGNGDIIEFGFVSGYAANNGPPIAGLVGNVTGNFTTAALQCLAAQNSLQQCEMLTEVFTTEAGATMLSQAGASAPPPYVTSFNIWRMDGGYGGK